MPTEPMIERFMPRYDAVERHGTTVAAPAHVVDACARSVDLGASPIVRLLLRARGMPGDRLRLDRIEQSGFRVLADRPGGEIVFGLIGRFWTASGGIRRFESADFTGFDEPGYAKAVWGFRMSAVRGGGTMLETETRVQCTDARSRRRFRLYWLVVRPGSGLIRRLILREIRRCAERAARHQPRADG